MQANLISHPAPVYPPMARNFRVQGTVALRALIGPDGKVQTLSVASGHPLLVPAAIDAVKAWTYRPTLINNKPVGVNTTIDVVFTLSN